MRLDVSTSFQGSTSSSWFPCEGRNGNQLCGEVRRKRVRTTCPSLSLHRISATCLICVHGPAIHPTRLLTPAVSTVFLSAFPAAEGR